MKYLKIDKGNKKLENSILKTWRKIFSGIKNNIKKINRECKSLNEFKGYPDCEEFGKIKINYNEDFDKIKFVGNDNLPIGKLIYFPAIAVTVRYVLKQGDIFNPQVYLDFVPVINDILRKK